MAHFFRKFSKTLSHAAGGFVKQAGKKAFHTAATGVGAYAGRLALGALL